MIHAGDFAIRTDLLILLMFTMTVLLQVFLCFKVKNMIFRLLPVCITLVLTVAFVTLGVVFDGWDSFGYFFLALCSAVLLSGSGIGWGIFAILKIKNK